MTHSGSRSQLAGSRRPKGGRPPTPISQLSCSFKWSFSLDLDPMAANVHGPPNRPPLFLLQAPLSAKQPSSLLGSARMRPVGSKAALRRSQPEAHLLAAVPILLAHQNASSHHPTGVAVRFPRLRAWMFFRSTSGCCSATSRSRSVGPSGSLFPCSHARTVSVLTFNAAANTG